MSAVWTDNRVIGFTQGNKGIGMKTKNPVAKFARKFNKAAVMIDRKKAQKRGARRKHKGEYA
jgi:hypothetical protein